MEGFKLRQTKTRMINGPFYTIHFTSGTASYCDVCHIPFILSTWSKVYIF